MKTCKDCIYYLMDKDRSYTTDVEGYCHLHPVPTATYDEHWCGQLKEKAPRATNLDELGLSNRAINMLKSYDIDIHKLRTMTEVDLLRLPNIGHGTLHDIRAALYKDNQT